jgi:hypothetical protein
VEIASFLDPLSDSNWASSHPLAAWPTQNHGFTSPSSEKKKKQDTRHGVINIAMGNSRTFFSFNGKNQKSINGVLNIAT